MCATDPIRRRPSRALPTAARLRSPTELHTAQIALLGDYLGSGWTLSSDGKGGTVVVDPSLYPNATNTGVQTGVKLTPYNGTLNLSTPGQIVSGLIISNGVQFWASNVTLENCIIDISNTGNWNIGVAGGLNRSCDPEL